MSDELHELKKRDADEHSDRLQDGSQQPASVLEPQMETSTLSEELNACKAEKARLEGTLEYLRNSFKLADEQRKSSEGKAEGLQKELEELKARCDPISGSLVPL